ncbi:DUF2341 domain-containing protein [Kosakonia sp. BYX6]|uniref:DUF2341 domain-containing protein n=1 Tax=Kosakonia calanthes TaxID=3139408 RepID=A0ABZ3BAT2_9ENTR
MLLRSFISLLIVTASLLLPSLSHAADWWQTEWKYRKQIAVDATPNNGNVSETVSRVPLLIRLHTGNFSFDGEGAEGKDLRFVTDDGKTVLNYQIESFDPLLGMATIWLDMPQIEGGTRHDISLYYGNDDAPQTSNGQTTFDANYTLVYHFNGAADAPPRDTTAYGNHAQTVAGTPVDSVIGRGLLLTGTPLMLPASPSLALAAGGAFTFSAWVRQDQPAGDQLLYARREAGNSLLIGVSQGTPFVEVNGQRSPQAQPLTPGAWQHLAVAADGQHVALYVQGRQTAVLAVALPALTTAAAIGGDVPAPAEPNLAAPETGATQPVAWLPFTGAIDEVRLSKIARPAALLLADATSQGSESRLVQYGADEQQSGFDFGGLAFLVKAVPFDAWIVLVILGWMMVHTWIVMIGKNKRTRQLQVGNEAFRTAFSNVGMHLESLADNHEAQAHLRDSSLWRLYEVGVHELRTRRQQGVDTARVTSETLETLRVCMDATRTREMQMLAARMGVLSNAIAGGPYIGLLGTVLGIMVVFLGTAMAGDVNINAIAPGMAAALLATAAGLFVAIPALFGYNRILSRNREISADMRVFVDEFIARLAEHGAAQPQS